jgi:hypothetical protein
VGPAGRGGPAACACAALHTEGATPDGEDGDSKPRASASAAVTGDVASGDSAAGDDCDGAGAVAGCGSAVDVTPPEARGDCGPPTDSASMHMAGEENEQNAANPNAATAAQICFSSIPLGSVTHSTIL